MPTASEINQFRRLIGDYNKDVVDDADLDSYLDDAVAELTADFATPVIDFDILVTQYKPEVILRAAINWWWQRAAELADKHSTSVGQSAQNVSEKWDRAMEMIRRLETRYMEIQQLYTDITFGNISRFSKSTLTRIGGQREEDVMDGP